MIGQVEFRKGDAMRVRSLRGRGLFRWFTVVVIVGLSVAGPGCSSDAGPQPVPADHLLVRTASGATMDVTGTAWTACILSDTDWSRTVMSFGPGTFTVASAAYATSTCTGEPLSSTAPVTAPIVATGDRMAGWGQDGPPPGVATTVTATGVVITWPEASGHPGEMKTVLFVNDGASPAALHFGGKTAGADGYPTTLESTARTLVP